MNKPEWDLVLSSGFLAFARHLGFLRAVEEKGLAIGGICGTSSGALVGALWASGKGTEELSSLFHVKRPITQMRLSRMPWKGLFTLGGLMKKVTPLLPERIEDLPLRFGVGVCGPDKTHRVISEGPLVPALLASCAVPGLFPPVSIDGEAYRDGGVVDRVGLEPWRRVRGEPRTLVHCVERSMGLDLETPSYPDVHVVHTPRSHAKLWNIGPFLSQVEEAYALTLQQLNAGGVLGE